MDREILREAGVEPSNPRRAYVEEFALRIGQRATLVLCYNLREAPQPHERNPEYAARLQLALSRLDFPAEYVASLS